MTIDNTSDVTVQIVMIIEYALYMYFFIKLHYVDLIGVIV